MAGNELLGFSTTQKRNLIRYVDEQTSGAALPAATTTTVGVVKQAAVQNPAAAADVATLKTQFDALLTKLKAAGLMASA